MIKYEDIKKIHVELSSKCNANCPGCPRNVQGGYELPSLKKAELSIDDFKKLFLKDFLKQIDSILFCGNYGDPITCNDIIPILTYIKSCSDANIRIHTNGSLRTPEFWKNIATILSPSDTIIWSIDGLSDTNHLYRRGTDWNKIIDNATSFIEAGGIATWEYLIFKHNEHQINEARELSKKLGFQYFAPKKAFGFESDNYAVKAMQVVNKNGDHDYFIHPPSEKNRNIDVLKAKQNKNEKLYPHSYNRNKFIEDYNIKCKELNKLVSEGYFDYLDDVEVSCSTINNSEIFIDSFGGVHPCCYLGHVSQEADSHVEIQYANFINMLGTSYNFNGITHGVRYIVENSYFNLIKETWSKTHRNGRIAQCSRMCSKNDNIIDSLYNKENA
jgi:MoaA/NifB/PqqE/SkfB family radical SAM enzyme